MQLAFDKDHFECEYCGTIYFHQKVREGMLSLGNKTNLECPLCHIPLAPVWVDQYRFLFCEQCRGKLIPSAIFVRMVNFLRSSSDNPSVIPSPMNSEELKRPIKCSNCHQRMNTHPYGGPVNIFIDNCPRCGFNWLDHHELDKIVRVPNRPTFATTLS